MQKFIYIMAIAALSFAISTQESFAKRQIEPNISAEVGLADASMDAFGVIMPPKLCLIPGEIDMLEDPNKPRGPFNRYHIFSSSGNTARVSHVQSSSRGVYQRIPGTDCYSKI